MTIAGSNLRAWTLALPVLRRLNELDIPFIVFKSLPLVEDLYAGAAGRPTTDVDLLVRARDVPAVLAASTELGWREAARGVFGLLSERLGPIAAGSHQPWPLIDPSHNPPAVIDLHSDELWRHTHSPLTGNVWSRAEQREQDGVRFLVLSPEDGLVFLCWHAFSEGLPARCLSDVGRLLMRKADLNWSYIATRCIETGLTSMVYCACALAGDAEGGDWKERLRRPRARVHVAVALHGRHSGGFTPATSRCVKALMYDGFRRRAEALRASYLPGPLELASYRGAIPGWREWGVLTAGRYARVCLHRLGRWRRPRSSVSAS
ncbi:MAG TPA: nucleotidyltransferase family protein [Chloroflexota bacterium]|nr:nucleotidyltransferase family protein [Chloroflexota bacterium]